MNKKLLVCDLDNTLYDWVNYFVPAFYSMIDEVIRITKCDREALLDDFRSVHRRHHDSEHPFSLLETRMVQKLFPNQSQKEIAIQLDPAFYAFNSARKENLQLYPNVRDSLEALSQSGVVLVAHTESKLYAVVDRLSRLDLAYLFQRIYCRERSLSQHPDPQMASKWLSQFPMEKVVELSHHQRKPDPDVLLEICNNEGVKPEEAAYVGDSVARDILMAKSTEVFAIWAKYGAFHSEIQYEKLVRVSHWTAEDVERERNLTQKAQKIKADYILQNNFGEILSIFLPTVQHRTAFS